MTITINIEGGTDELLEELVRLAQEEFKWANGARLQRDQREHKARASAFRQAAELTDAAIRSMNKGGPVERRRFDNIVMEVQRDRDRRAASAE